MKTPSLCLSIEPILTKDVLALRALCYGSEYTSGEYEDEFDARSSHVLLRQDDLLIAYGRLTPGPSAVFYHWTNGNAQLPYGADSIDLGRCMVHPAFRRSRFFELICVTAMQYAYSANYAFLNGAVVEGSPWLDSLERLGLKKSGPLVQGKQDLIQPLSCDLRQAKPVLDECAGNLYKLLQEIPFKLIKNS